MPNWESLIAERKAMHGDFRDLREPDPRKRAKQKKALRFYHAHKDEPEFRKKRLDYMHGYHQRAEVKERHAAQMREWRKNHVLTEHEIELRTARNRRYRERKKQQKQQKEAA